MDYAPNNPLHLLDDHLASLTPTPTPTPEDTSSHEEAHHDQTLRVAADLFEGQMSLLENALSLLEEQEQCQREMRGGETDEVVSDQSIIRVIQAKRSGRKAIIIQKRRGNKRHSKNTSDTKLNDYYLCLLGRDKSDSYNQIHRRGMHCTCKSFLNNIRGSSRKSTSGGDNATTNAGYSHNIICKHLLAVILMPHLMPWCKEGVGVEVLEDKVFAKLIASCQI